MFCSKCGKQIPENTKFCNYCGAQQKTNEDNFAPQQPTKEAPKKKANVFIVLAVVICAFIVGKFVIAPSFTSDSDKDKDSSKAGQSTVSQSTSNTKNQKYSEILTQAHIVHFQMFFNMDMKNFVLKQGDGTIYCVDYGYKEDVVKQWVETIYIPVSEYTETEKTNLETTMKAEFATTDALNCCAVKYDMGVNYFTITCTYSDVDKAENYGELYNAGVLKSNSFISISATEESLINQGFVKK